MPARVVTTPALMARRVWLPVSATKRVPVAATVRPVGPEKEALTPVPSALPGAPAVPARVLTMPALIWRIVWLWVSAT